MRQYRGNSDGTANLQLVQTRKYRTWQIIISCASVKSIAQLQEIDKKAVVVNEADNAGGLMVTVMAWQTYITSIQYIVQTGSQNLVDILHEAPSCFMLAPQPWKVGITGTYLVHLHLQHHTHLRPNQLRYKKLDTRLAIPVRSTCQSKPVTTVQVPCQQYQ